MSNRSVEAGQVKHWSPSQIKTFTLCNRRWAGEKVFHLPVEWQETKQQAEGSNVHNEIEAWGLHGTEPKHPLAQLAIDWLGPNTDKIRLWEEQINLQAADVPCKGYIDLHDITNPEEVLVIDWKTRGSFDYLLDSEALRSDVQMISYGLWAANKYRAKRVRLTHANLRTGLKKPRADNAFRPISTDMTADELRVAFRPAEDSVMKMKVIAAEAKEFNDVPAKPGEACWAFNKPCPFISVCRDAVYINPTTYGQRGPSTNATPPPTEGALTMADVNEQIKQKVRARGINPPDAAKPLELEKKALETQSSTPVPVTQESTATIQPEVDAPLILFVDCLPSKGNIAAQNLEDLIAPVAKAICEREGVKDVRLVKYGQGVAMLSAYFKENTPKGFVLASSTGLSGSVVDTLSNLAAQVWRGVR